jgi:hypothetical protein
MSNRERFESEIVKCDLCSFVWVAVMPVNTEKLECPKCENICYYEKLENH